MGIQSSINQGLSIASLLIHTSPAVKAHAENVAATKAFEKGQKGFEKQTGILSEEYKKTSSGTRPRTPEGQIKKQEALTGIEQKKIDVAEKQINALEAEFERNPSADLRNKINDLKKGITKSTQKISKLDIAKSKAQDSLRLNQELDAELAEIRKMLNGSDK